MRKLCYMFGISAAFLCFTVQAEFIDLTTAGSSGSATAVIGGIYQVEQINPQSTGTGVIDPFLRVQASGNNDSEMGYNTDANPEYDAKGGAFTTALLLADIPIVNGNYQFLLDINQINSTPEAALLSLNQIQIFRGAADVGNTNETIAGTSPPIISFGAAATEVFRMSSAAALDEIRLNFDLNPGSGAGDMFLYVPVAAFAAATGDYVTFFSQFGTPPGPNATNDGFEEWAILRGSTGVIPEPSSVVLLTSIMAALGFSLRNRFKQNV